MSPSPSPSQSSPLPSYLLFRRRRRRHARSLRREIPPPYSSLPATHPRRRPARAPRKPTPPAVAAASPCGVGTHVSAMPAPALNLITNDAFVYLKVVKDKFYENRPKYDIFLESMSDVRSKVSHSLICDGYLLLQSSD